MGKMSKRVIEKALLRALQDESYIEEVGSELSLHGGSLRRLKKRKKYSEPDPPLVVEDSV